MSRKFIPSLSQATGGVIGYMRKGSVPSLIGGVGLSSLFLYSAYTINNGDSKLGHDIALVASALTTGAMGSQYLKKRTAVPGVVAALGAASTAYQLNKCMEWRS